MPRSAPAQIARIEKMRAARDEAKVRAALDRAGGRARGGDANLLELSVDSGARCAQRSARFRMRWSARSAAITPRPSRCAASTARRATTTAGKRRKAARNRSPIALGRKPRIMVAKMGQDGHDRGANLVVVGVHRSGLRSDPRAAVPDPARDGAKWRSSNDVDVVGASSLAAGHQTLIPELIEALKDMGRADIKVVAGGVIPPQDYAMLRAAGVQAIFGPGTNLADAADEVLRLLGHNRPPLDEAAE